MNVDLPLVSILIPTYNRANLVVRAIKSAQDQTYPNIEIIVGDNVSTDETETVLKQLMESDPRITYFKNKINLGPVGNWKACGERAAGDFIYLLFSDDLISSDCINEHVAVFLDNPDIAFSYSNLQSIYPDGSIHRVDYENTPVGKFESEKFIIGEVLPGKAASSPGLSIDYPITPACALFRKADFSKNLRQEIINPLDIKFETVSHSGMGNDLALFLLTALDYPQVNHINKNLAFSAPDGGNLSTIYGGQENFYHYLVMKSCLDSLIAVENPKKYESAWNDRNADFLAYLMLNNMSTAFAIFKQVNPKISYFKLLLPSIKKLGTFHFKKLIYKVGVLKASLLASSKSNISTQKHGVKNQ